MLKKSLVFCALVTSIFAGTAIAAGYDRQDESLAPASSMKGFAAEYDGADEARPRRRSAKSRQGQRDQEV